ncbi:hypothetical protein AB0D04_29415 [Streptomyces sp. NPDC048483]|uniref:hypothetical protein n=1 Tax=Streptomyces sp. NPDC048483 TaxID=3154927 RepID=UPI0034224059
MSQAEEDVIRDYVAVCPLTPEVVEDIVTIADIDWPDRDVRREAIRSVGWRDDNVPFEGGEFMTGAGHLVNYSPPSSLSAHSRRMPRSRTAKGSAPSRTSRAP